MEVDKLIYEFESHFAVCCIHDRLYIAFNFKLTVADTSLVWIM